jgi:murein DD-endopeptidase MepM/ murein hydrolase activator NlpD
MKSAGLLLLSALVLAPIAVTSPARAQAPAPTDSVTANQKALDEAKKQEQQQLDLEAQKQKELEDLRSKAAKNRGLASQLKGQENQILSQLRRVERDLGLTRRRLRTLEQRRAQLDREHDVAQQNLVRTQQSLTDQRAVLGRRLRSMYKLGPAREMEFLLSTRSFAELLSRWDFLVRVARQDRALLQGIQSQKEQVLATETRIEGNLKALEKNKRATASENRRLAALRTQHTRNMEQIKNQREAYEAAAAELERTARSVQKLLAQLEAKRKSETEKARAEGRPAQPYSGEFAKGRGALDWPVRGKIVGAFGPETHPRFGTTTLNNGIDIAAPAGTPVRSVAKGRVEFTNDDFASFGQVVVVNHGDGYYTLYGHLSEILVTTGQEVQAGQSIGRVGDSGTSLKGTVLHFEVRKGGTALNPEDWLQ